MRAARLAAPAVLLCLPYAFSLTEIQISQV
jgi:hypothetical protein